MDGGLNLTKNTKAVTFDRFYADLPNSIVSGMKWKIHRHYVSAAFKEKTQTKNFGDNFQDNGSGAKCEVYLVFPSGAATPSGAFGAQAPRRAKI